MTGVPGVQLRPIVADEYPAFARAVELPFGEEPDDEQIARWQGLCELDRTIAALDRGRIVGTAGAYSYRLSLPAGEARMAGVTAVAVAPTHRRRGLLTAMMRRQLDDVAERGEPLAGLWAAEAPIYGRFGYGVVAPSVYGRIATQHAAFRPDVEVEQGIELVDVDTALAGFPVVYDKVRAGRPGMPDRSAELWSAWLRHDPDKDRDGASRRQLARLGDRGYVVYRIKPTWEHALPAGEVTVVEHMATDPVAAASLWRYCLDLDLVTSCTAPGRPPDDELPLLLADPRRLSAFSYDGLWLRFVHLPEALTARGYSAAGAVVVEVADTGCPHNAGRWRLETSPDGSVCERTSAEPELRLDVAALTSAWLGTFRVTRQVRAGLVDEVSPGAAARADALFATDPSPWCPQEF